MIANKWVDDGQQSKMIRRAQTKSGKPPDKRKSKREKFKITEIKTLRKNIKERRHVYEDARINEEMTKDGSIRAKRTCDKHCELR